MRLMPADFDYVLPPELVAISPAESRSKSRLLVYNRARDKHELSEFKNLGVFLKPGDLLVFNQTRVLKARFFATRETGAQLEGLLIKDENESVSVWLKGKAQKSEFIQLKNGPQVELLERNDKQARLKISGAEFRIYLEKFGAVALPPYIRTERTKRGISAELIEDEERYQSLFATAVARSSAAPTASLHFDKDLLANLTTKGVERADLELDVGLGTFEPLNEHQSIDEQTLHSESVRIPELTIEKIRLAKSEGRRVIAVGTTVLRALESWAQNQNAAFETNLFIRPGYEFKVADALITNFHWPKSSLLILVASFLGALSKSDKNEWKELYQLAIEERFRFFSYGDGMLIL